MNDLTDEKKKDCEAVVNELLNHLWNKVVKRMDKGQSLEDAVVAVMQEILND